MDTLKNLIDWLTQFVSVLQNPAFLIFFCALVLGWAIKNITFANPIPNWTIPLVLAFLGIIAGAILLGVGAKGRFQGALTGMTLALASTGFHQIFAQIQERFFNDKPTNQNP